MLSLENTRTLYDLLVNAGEEYAAKTFLKYEREDVFYDRTYSRFLKDSKIFGAWVQSIEKSGQTHVAMLGRCSYRFLVALFGTVSSGDVAVLLDVQAQKETLIENINKADTDVLLYDWEFHSEVEVIKEACPNIQHFVCMQKVQELNVPDICSSFKDAPFVPAAKAEECALIIFTSGTTGQGKGVMLSHANLIDNVFNSTEKKDQSSEVNMNVLPIHHIFCLSGDVLLTMRYGSMLCLCPEVSKILKYITIYKPTSLRAVPMISKMLYQRIALYRKNHSELSEMEVKNQVLGENFHRIVSGGGYLSKELALGFSKLGIDIGQGYGMSECSPKITSPDYERPEKLDSVGRVVERCQIRIVDGEIQVKSPSVMMGYYHEPELTKEALTEDGWLCTGDMGYLDDENYLYLTGRKKNLIILSNGENVAPEGIENLFDGEMLVSDILVYGENDTIAAEIYPNYEYAQANNISDIEQALQEIINRVNQDLPPYSKIVRCGVRKYPFEKTSSKKIIREKFFENRKQSENKRKSIQKPQNEVQQTIYEILAEITGNELIGIDDDFYTCGMDSMGSVLFIEEISQRLNQSINLSELLENSTITRLEALLEAKKKEAGADLSVREVYPLTNMQKYFAYIIRGNTTSNLPFLYDLHRDIDMERLAQAMEAVIDAHPGLKAKIHSDGTMLMVYRDDSRKIKVPVLKMSEDEWQEKKKHLIVPFAYTPEDDLVHVCLCETEQGKYMFLDVAHAMGDGITMNILIEDICRSYCNKEVTPEKYTFFEYILEDLERQNNGERQKDIDRVAELLKGSKLTRSILNKRLAEDTFQPEYGVIRSRFETLTHKKILYFCKKYGVSENVLFLTAFNYCIYLFSDEDDVISNSIHSGRTDSRYARVAGSFFMTYLCRFVRQPHERVIPLLKKMGQQIMNTMKSAVATSRQGEMFFQYQGDILGQNVIGDLPAQREHVQLDSLPFHMQVMSDDKGYFQELRYWRNRFDKQQLEIFLTCYEAVVSAMLEEDSVRRLKRHLPEEVYPKHFYISAKQLKQEAGYPIVGLDGDEQIKVYIMDESYHKKPYGAWGKLYVMNEKPAHYTKELENPYSEGVLYETEHIARILPDLTLDFLENNGRTVVTDGVHGLRQFYLKNMENAAKECEGVQEAKAYLYFDTEINEMSPALEFLAKDGVTEETVRTYLESHYEGTMIPKKIKRVS